MNSMFLFASRNSRRDRKLNAIDNLYVTTDEDKKLNASYIISVARKLGCSIFLLPEDILEVRNSNPSINRCDALLLSIFQPAGCRR